MSVEAKGGRLLVGCDAAAAGGVVLVGWWDVMLAVVVMQQPAGVSNDKSGGHVKGCMSCYAMDVIYELQSSVSVLSSRPLFPLPPPPLRLFLSSPSPPSIFTFSFRFLSFILASVLSFTLSYRRLSFSFTPPLEWRLVRPHSTRHFCHTVTYRPVT